jgi:hypothetical protein
VSGSLPLTLGLPLTIVLISFLSFLTLTLSQTIPAIGKGSDNAKPILGLGFIDIGLISWLGVGIRLGKWDGVWFNGIRFDFELGLGLRFG